MYRPLPKELTIKNSPIEGLGLFATKDIKANTFIGVTHIRDEQFENKYIRTPLGGFYNHSNEPNIRRVVSDNLPKLKCGDQIDDSLDVFPVHGVGGMLGIIMLALIGSPDGFLGSGAAGISDEGMMAQLVLQIEGILVIGLWTIIATYIILRTINIFTEIRVSSEAEEEGLDIHEHNESGYSL